MPSLALLRAARGERRVLPRILPFLPLLLRRPRARPLTVADAATEPRDPPGARRERSPRAADPVTVVSVIRNGIENGYPFVESYASWARFAGRIVVVDGESSDGTDRVLAELAALLPQLEVVSRPWPAASSRGAAIARFTDAAIDYARDGARLMYVQADEVYTEDQRKLVCEWKDGAVEFAGYVNFWNALDRVLANEPDFALVRLLPPEAPVTSLGDGYSFAVHGARVTTVPERVLHYGWCFPVNILQKHVNHARLYPESAAYRLRGFLARRMLATGVDDLSLLDALAPHYRAVPFTGEHPECMRHLVGRSVYDPSLGLELIARGAEW